MVIICTFFYHDYITIKTSCLQLIWITEQINKWPATDLETPLDSFQLLFSDFGMPSCHVSWLLRIKWVSDAPWYEHIQLNPSFTFFFFPFLFVLPKFQKREANRLKFPYIKLRKITCAITVCNTNLYLSWSCGSTTFEGKVYMKLNSNHTSQPVSTMKLIFYQQ